MIKEKPPSAGGGLSGMSSAGCCFDTSEIKPPRPNTQIKFQEPAEADDRHAPFGRAGPFRIIEDDLAELVEIAARMERRA